MPRSEPSLPAKLYFKIGEVSALAGVKPHVLRYWETEFPALQPIKTRSAHRLYRKQDVGLILEIRKLLHEQGYTIAGARKKIQEGALGRSRSEEDRLRKSLLEIYRGLKRLQASLR